MKVQYLKAVRSITASAKQAQCQEEPGLVRHDFSVNMDQNLRESMRKVFDSAWDMISAHTDRQPATLVKCSDSNGRGSCRNDNFD